MSLYHKIRIIFLVAFLFVSAFFGLFLFINDNTQKHDTQKRYMQTARFVLVNLHNNNNQDSQLVEILKENNFRLLPNSPDTISNIKSLPLVFSRKTPNNNKVEVYKGHKNNYLAFEDDDKIVMVLEDLSIQKSAWEIMFGYAVSLVFLIMLYLWLIGSLKPLKVLQTQIQRVVSGDLSVSTHSNATDEIGQVANAFDAALRKIETLINSRQLFLRTIMHELKTPIAKGVILTEFVEKAEIKKGYENVFERLELLIEEFSKIEQMLSSNYQLKPASYSMIDIIEQAMELMILDEEEIQQQITIVQNSNLIVHSDFDLLSLAFKNLISNAISYSPSHHATIRIEKNSVIIENDGKQFTQNIQSCFVPFHAGSNGSGLGLYIVKNILDLLNHKLKYVYDKKNIFIIEF
ncbi:MAG: ArsS family sensor histidine kinase [Sulfurovaceae bacterium]|nr:ArsS family sensor histidine kinase [Sulfurovaceae bacterium]